MSKFTSKAAARKDAQKQGKNLGEIEIQFHENGKHYTWKMAEVATVAPTPEPKKAETEQTTKKVSSKKKHGKRLLFMPDAIITVLVPENPKRKESASRERFSFYKTGMSVGDALKAGLRPDDFDNDVKKDFITIE